MLISTGLRLSSWRTITNRRLPPPYEFYRGTTVLLKGGLGGNKLGYARVPGNQAARVAAARERKQTTKQIKPA